MGLFDFPRIHFKGNIDLNVPTINNSYYFPLTIYDQTRSRAFLPPRLYFTKPEVVAAVNAPIKPIVINDPDNSYCYIEILPINTIELVRKWCMTPLGSPDSPDKDYIPFYNAANNDLGSIEGTPNLIGIAPGYWNMFGDMGVSMNNVLVTGIQTFDGDEIKTWTNESANLPPAIELLLGSGVDMDASAANGRTTAVMAETISSQSVYASIFCSNFNLFNKSDPSIVYLKGKPFRFSALLYAAWRVVNWLPAMAGSARWCSSIPLENMEDIEKDALMDFFEVHKPQDARELKGVFLSFTTHEVFENRYNQEIYASGPIQNPAQATTIGSIAPWYEGDMSSGIIGRNLISLFMDPYYTNAVTNSGIQMIPAIANLQNLPDGKAIFSVDMGNSWPEQMTPAFVPGKLQPAKRGDASFETFPLGKLSIRYGTDASQEFASINVDPINTPITKLAQSGCIFDTIISDQNLISAIENNLINVYGNVNGKEVHLLSESEYMLATDQKGLYAEEGDYPSQGYMVYSDKRIPCRLRINRLGKPVLTPVEITIAEYIVPEAANDPLSGPDNTFTQSLVDNGIVTLVDETLTLKNNAVYYFVYPNQYLNNPIPPFSTNSGYTIQDTGSFACLRVYPKIDYQKYLDPKNLHYTAPDYELVYEEVFKLYDVVYPAMALVHPFTKQTWDNGIMAGLVLQRTDPAIWADILYMSRSRELSDSQRALLVAWANTYNESSMAPLLPSTKQTISTSIPRFNIELRKKATPEGLPLVQSGAWAVWGNKLLLIGGLIEGFHGLNQENAIFGNEYANKSIWVVDLENFSTSQLQLDRFNGNWQPLCSSNMQFYQEADTLYIVGGYGALNASDKQSNHTFNTLIAVSISAMISSVEKNADPSSAILYTYQSPIFEVAGGELFKYGNNFYLAFGQDFSKIYDPGTTGIYTSDIRIFNLNNGQVNHVGTCTDPALYRRDLNVVPLVQNSGVIYAGLGGVFDKLDNGFLHPVYFDPNQPGCGVKQDGLSQITNQYNCAKLSIFDTASNTTITVLLGGIGQYQYHPETGNWENGDDGAKLPFVKTITQMIYSNGQMQQYIQLPPDAPEMPALIGANAIFIPYSELLLSQGIIDYNKVGLDTTNLGVFYGGIESVHPTSNQVYPTFVNKSIYEVVLHKI